MNKNREYKSDLFSMLMEYSVSEIAAKLAVSEQKVREVLGEDN